MAGLACACTCDDLEFPSLSCKFTKLFIIFLLQRLNSEALRLDQIKADKEYIDAELDAKADKVAVDGKVNRSVFDSSVSDLQKMLDDLLSKLLAYVSNEHSLIISCTLA